MTFPRCQLSPCACASSKGITNGWLDPSNGSSPGITFATSLRVSTWPPNIRRNTYEPVYLGDSIVNAKPRRVTPSGFVVSSHFSSSYSLSYMLLDSPVRKIYLGCRVQSGGLRTGTPAILFPNSPILHFSLRVV